MSRRPCRGQPEQAGVVAERVAHPRQRRRLHHRVAAEQHQRRAVGDERGEHGAAQIRRTLIGQRHHVAHAHARRRGLPGRLEPRHVAEVLRLHVRARPGARPAPPRGAGAGSPAASGCAEPSAVAAPAGRVTRAAPGGPDRGSPQAGQATSASCWRGRDLAAAAGAPLGHGGRGPAGVALVLPGAEIDARQPAAGGQRARAGMAQRRPSASSQRPKTRLALCPPKPKPFDRP